MTRQPTISNIWGGVRLLLYDTDRFLGRTIEGLRGANNATNIQIHPKSLKRLKGTDAMFLFWDFWILLLFRAIHRIPSTISSVRLGFFGWLAAAGDLAKSGWDRRDGGGAGNSGAYLFRCVSGRRCVLGATFSIALFISVRQHNRPCFPPSAYCTSNLRN